MNLAVERPDLLWLLLLAVPLCGLAWASKRRQSTLRRWTSLALRLALLTLIALALSGLTRLHETDQLAVVFVMDRSTSVGADGQRAS